MRDGKEKSAEGHSFEASFPSSMPLGQKVLLTVFFACTEGQDRPIEETHAELAALCGMDLSEYFEHLLELRIAGLVTPDDGECRGLRINRRAIKNAKAIDERAARAAQRVRSQGPT
jgi:hypothetical protein